MQKLVKILSSLKLVLRINFFPFFCLQHSLLLFIIKVHLFNILASKVIFKNIIKKLAFFLISWRS